MIPLSRLTWPAADLVAAHPPRFSNENKERVHAIACPLGALHAGTITATRWDTMPLPEQWQRPTLGHVEWHPGPYDYVTRLNEAMA